MPVAERPNALPSQYAAKGYYCRSCDAQVQSVGIPSGWFIIKKSHGPAAPLKTVTIVCSLPCLVMDSTKELVHRIRDRVDKYVV